MAAITLEHITKRYENGVEAVKGVNLEVPDGALCVLVGPSGCGKTTTLRMIAGLESVTDGAISIGGRVVNDVHPKDRDIAMVFQSYALYPHMSVYDNMAFALKIRRVARAEIERRVHGAAEMLGLKDLLARKPGALSGGQRQRVAVGRAIVREPKAFLFDEPLSNLDAKLRVSTRTEIKALQARLKTTTVYVTHDQEEAMSLADVMVVMAKGLVQQIGRPMEVYRRPANRFVGTFVGLPAMNLLEGRVEARGGDGLWFVGTTLGEDGRECALGLSEEHGAKLRGRDGQSVTLGVRPNGLSLGRPEEPGAWRMRVGVVETMGDHTDVLLQPRQGARLVCRMGQGEEPDVGAEVGVRVDARAVHVFEPGEFGANLTL